MNEEINALDKIRAFICCTTNLMSFVRVLAIQDMCLLPNFHVLLFHSRRRCTPVVSSSINCFSQFRVYIRITFTICVCISVGVGIGVGRRKVLRCEACVN